MSLPRTVGEILREHTTLEVESLDRMYLNVYVPGLQSEGSVAWFFRTHRGQLFASSALMAPMSKAFVAAIEAFVAEHELPLISFEKKQRKDDVAAGYLTRWDGREGVLFVGKAQEKVAVKVGIAPVCQCANFRAAPCFHKIAGPKIVVSCFNKELFPLTQPCS